MHQIIILAGGKDRHGWTAEQPKVMALVKGIPVVLRVIRQVEKFNLKPVVLTHRKNVQAVVPDSYVPSKPHSFRPVGALADSVPLWGIERTTILCGDTVYPPEVLKRILLDESPLSVWGDEFEIYGITFVESQYERVRKAIERAMAHHPTLVRYGLLWAFYRALCGNKSLGHHVFEKVIFKHVQKGTYIKDFDGTEKYARWLRAHSWAA